MKEMENNLENINRIYDLEIIQNKYVGIGFDPADIRLSALFKAEDVFNSVFEQENAGELLADIRVDGKEIRDYMKDLLLQKNIYASTKNDIDRYCKAFVLFGMTEEKPAVTIERDGQSTAVNTLPGLDHRRDHGNVMSLRMEYNRSTRLDTDIDKIIKTDSVRTRQILSDAGVDPSDKTQIKSLFITWYVSEYGKSFSELGRIEALSDRRKKGLGAMFLRDLEAHPIKGETPDKETVQSNLQWYGSLTQCSMDLFEESYRIPGLEGNLKAQNFDFATEYAGGLDSFVEKILTEVGPGSPENVYSLNCREEFKKGYGKDPQEFSRQRNVLYFTAKMSSFREITDDSSLDRLGKLMAGCRRKTLREAAEDPEVYKIISLMNGVRDGKLGKFEEVLETEFGSGFRDRMDYEINRMRGQLFPEMDVFDGKEYTLDLHKMEKKDLDKAEEVFDRIFADVRMIADPWLRTMEDKELVDLFRLETYSGKIVSLSDYLDDQHQNHNWFVKVPDRDIAYRKAMVLLQLESEKNEKELQRPGKNVSIFHPKYDPEKSAVVNTDDFYTSIQVSQEDRKDIKQPSEDKVKEYKAAAGKKREENKAKWKTEEKPEMIGRESFNGFFTESAMISGGTYDFINSVKSSFGALGKNDPYMKLFSVYALAEKNVTLEQFHLMYDNRNNPDNEKKIRELIEDFKKDIKARPVSGNVTKENRQENLRWYGRLYRNALDKVFDMDYSFPDKDVLYDRDKAGSISGSSQEQVIYYLNAFEAMPPVLRFEKENAGIKPADHFREGFGGAQTYSDYRAKSSVITQKRRGDVYRYSGTAKNVDGKYNIVMLGDLILDDPLSGKNVKDISMADYRLYNTIIAKLNNVGVDGVTKAVPKEDKIKFLEMNYGNPAVEYKDIYDKTVMAWADAYPFVKEITDKAGKLPGYKSKPMDQSQKKRFDEIEDARTNSQKYDLKAEEEARLFEERKKAEEEAAGKAKEEAARKAEWCATRQEDSE